jgi:predicted RNA-binding Zn-ribbon protein involved in translation (DUF1610 family)
MRRPGKRLRLYQQEWDALVALPVERQQPSDGLADALVALCVLKGLETNDYAGAYKIYEQRKRDAARLKDRPSTINLTASQCTSCHRVFPSHSEALRLEHIKENPACTAPSGTRQWCIYDAPAEFVRHKVLQTGAALYKCQDCGGSISRRPGQDRLTTPHLWSHLRKPFCPATTTLVLQYVGHKQEDGQFALDPDCAPSVIWTPKSKRSRVDHGAYECQDCSKILYSDPGSKRIKKYDLANHLHSKSCPALDGFTLHYVGTETAGGELLHLAGMPDTFTYKPQRKQRKAEAKGAGGDAMEDGWGEEEGQDEGEAQAC